jgi:hypothetical protein
MDAKIIALLIICVAAVLIAGCTGGSAPPAGTATPTHPAPAPDATTTQADTQSCKTDQECVPAQCCHPMSCIKTIAKQPCTMMCTMSCEGPLDCGAGSCGCVNGKCSVVPAQATAGQTGQKASVRLEASPQRYSPMMSSTPGIGLTPNVTGFNSVDATFEWNATFGRFLMWDAPDYKVHDIGNPVATDGRTIYWTFIEKPASTKDPVVITVTARDTTQRGAVLASSTVTLSWDGDYAVMVRDIT